MHGMRARITAPVAPTTRRAPTRASRNQHHHRARIEVNASTSTRENAPTHARTLEYMVEMRCGACVAKVEAAVRALAGTIDVSASLSSQTVTTTTRDDASTVSRAIASCGYNVRLIGQGATEGFTDALAAALGMDVRTLRQSVAAVAEFKGEKYNHGDVKGTVRFVQANADAILAEAALDGLSPGVSYAIRVHESGDVTRGVRSVGAVYGVDGDADAGVVGVVDADARGAATMPSTILSGALKAWDIIGRSVVICPTHAEVGDGVAAVLARSAGVGENHKKLCQCDGTVIWEAGEDFVPVKVAPSNANGGLLSKDKVTARRG